jgi:3'(2'), 5'-bisphosphate nucleotidase
MEQNARNDLAIAFGAIASEAGRFILERYPHIHVRAKSDGSPVSDADSGAEDIIRTRLASLLPDVRMIAEESFDGATGAPPERFLLIDPIDGTREFVAGGDHYTVNIALIEHGRPVVGCIYAPAHARLYLAGASASATALSPGAPVDRATLQPLRTHAYDGTGLRAVISHSHLDSATETWLTRRPVAARRPVGSSLKFCLVAHGEADVYPRLGETMEWDTAAGDAIVTAAGGRVLDAHGETLRYGKAGLRNRGFIAWGGEPVPATS